MTTRDDGGRVPAIYVCNQCLKRSCWDWIFACDKARGAGLVLKTRDELDALNREHPSYYEKAFESGGERMIHATRQPAAPED